MTQYVIIRDMSTGNETVGEMWQETKIFPPDATLHEVMKWAEDSGFGSNQSRRNIRITRAHEEKE